MRRHVPIEARYSSRENSYCEHESFHNSWRSDHGGGRFLALMRPNSSQCPMYLPVEVVADEQSVGDENPQNVESQHLQHQHPLANYNERQHPQDIQLPLNSRDQYHIHHPAHFLLSRPIPHHLHQQRISTLASPLRPQHGAVESGEQIFNTRCEYEHEKKHLRQQVTTGHLDPCAECQQPIRDRFYLLVAEQCWHADCLRCCVCKTKLESQLTCFSREGLIYCKDDYYQRFCKRCARCNRILSPKELVMRAKEFIFHLHCFNCAVCSGALQPGDYFALAPSGHLYCQHHYEPLFYGSGTVTVAPQSGSPSVVDVDHSAKAIGFRTISSSPGSSRKNSCAEGGEMTPGLSKGGGQKGRPKKRKLNANEQEQQEMGGPCMLPSLEASAVSHHQAQLHPSALGGNGAGNLLLTSTHLPTTPMSVIQSARSSPTGGPCSSLTIHSQGSHGQQQTRSKRMRTSFKHHQLRTMKAYFSLNHNPDAKDLKQLAQKTGLTKRVLQVWFQNARAKYRRSVQIKQQQETQDSQNPSTTPAPASGAAGCGTSSSDVGDAVADQEEHSGDAEALTAGTRSTRQSTESSNASSDYSLASREFSSRSKGSLVEFSTTVGQRSKRHEESPATQRQRTDSFSEDDSASRTLADYFQQCQGGLL